MELHDQAEAVAEIVAVIVRGILSVRRTRYHQCGAGADESRSRESANGHAQLAPAPPPERPSPVLGAWASGSGHVIEHCHGQLLVLWKRISARAYEDGGMRRC